MTNSSSSAESMKLLPCPFCGAQPVTERTGFSLRAMYIYCINDNGCPRPKAIGESEEKAIENWNTRTPAQPASEPDSEAGSEEAVHRALAAFRDAANSMVECKRCSGKGYHHGFGEDGQDPDWCEVCGGCQTVPEFDDLGAMRKALEAAGSCSPPESITAKEYVDRAIASFNGDPPDNQFQRGYLSALEVVRDEAFSATE